MGNTIKLDLGHNIGIIDIPVGSRVFFDAALPILIRCLSLWRKTDIQLLDDLSDNSLAMFLGLKVDEDIDEPISEDNRSCLIKICESDEIISGFYDEKTTIIFLNAKNGSFDYKITLNGIFNYKNELIKEYRFLTENDNLICNKTGMSADRGFFGLNISGSMSSNRLFIFNYNGNQIEPVLQNYLVNTIINEDRKNIIHVGNENRYCLDELVLAPIDLKDQEMAGLVWDEIIRPKLRVFDKKDYRLAIDESDDPISALQFFLNQKRLKADEKMAIIDRVKNLRFPISLLKSTNVFLSSKILEGLSEFDVMVIRKYLIRTKSRRSFYLFAELTESNINNGFLKNMTYLINRNQSRDRIGAIISNMTSKKITFGNNMFFDDNENQIGDFCIQDDGTLSTGVYSVADISGGEYHFHEMNISQNRLESFAYSENNLNSYFYEMAEVIALIKSEDLFGILRNEKLNNHSDAYSWNILHLLVCYSQSFEFLSKAFDEIVRSNPSLFKSNRNYLNLLIEYNDHFYRSNLILALDWFLSKYEMQSNRYENSCFYVFDRIIATEKREAQAEAYLKVINELTVKYFPIKLLKDKSTDYKEKILEYYIDRAAVRKYYHILNSTNIDFICDQLFKSKGKLIKKYFINEFEKNPIYLIEKLIYISTFFDNYDLKISALNILDENNHGSESAQGLKSFVSIVIRGNRYRHDLSFFIKNTSINNRKKILLCNLDDVGLLRDSITLFFEYYEKTGGVFNVDGFNSIKEFHDGVAVALRKIGSDNKIFDNDEIKSLHNYCFEINDEKYKLRLPNDSDDVYALGSDMSICIGSEMYIKTHVQKTHFIAMLDKNDKLYAAIHCFYQNGDIKQIKRKYNELVSSDEEKGIQAAIYKAKSGL